ncbi:MULTISPECIES: hypothetical protein [unclassified Aureimonas]|uniref:hypothetical protein n=1 Tax=unclassified Aureimonas TaxID=2615206 RepID=UPI0007018E7C|nr:MULTISPECIES: hypothetical protein [unclassified Aureimonas]KQT61291.1 hypothetical protein ASG54_24480 [Aureimonas sp. Leaf460]KQT68740.1 hypothetical protein ASG62_19240 [Aureimonas sp. Leaf427]
MLQSSALRFASLAAAALLAAACSSTGKGGPSASDPGPVAAAAPLEGKPASWCPQISLRDGTAILRKRAGEDLEYIASVTATNRDCRVVDGQLRMKIGIAGRVVPGPAGKAGAVSLPIRIAVVEGTNVLYSNKGEQSVQVTPGGAAGEFVYVDNNVSVPEPTAKTLVVFAGFDEGPGR